MEVGQWPPGLVPVVQLERDVVEEARLGTCLGMWTWCVSATPLTRLTDMRLNNAVR